MKNSAISSMRWKIGFAVLFVVFTATFMLTDEPKREPILAQSAISFLRTPVVIETRTGRHRFTMELAEAPGQHAGGLMGRQSLAADSGMLFVYTRPHRVAMWMKDTLLPLDMLFVRPDGVIDSIVERTTPLSLATIRSAQPVRAVVEVNAGTVKRLGIKTGDRVIHDAFNLSD
jgi:uncharacterized membrane protein (UPF0127 family)